MFRPVYLGLSPDELRERVARGVASLEECRACPRDCGVNRLEDRWAACKTGRLAIVGSWFPHFGEEDCLRGWNGSGTIFFSHCNLRCVFCFAPGTRVATEDGLVPIERFFEEGRRTEGEEVRRVGDGARVVTREGRPARVAKAFRHRYRGELVRLKPYCCPPLTLTSNHELFAIHVDDPERVIKVAAGSLTGEHRIVLPAREPLGETVTVEVAEILGEVSVERRRPPTKHPSEELVTLFGQRWTSRQLSQITGHTPSYLRGLRGKWIRGDFGLDRDEIVENELVVEAGKVRFQTERRPGIPLRLTLDERLAWLLGFYCAEGHVTSSKTRPNSHVVVFSLAHSEHERAKRVEALLHELFGVTPHIVKREATYTVEVGKASLGTLLKRLCGKGAHDKRVPAPVLRGDRDVLCAFLEGVAAGDGWEGPTHTAINTVSENFAYGLFQIGLLLGMLPTYHEWRPPPTTEIEDRTVNQSPLHSVKFPKRNPATARRHSRWRRTPVDYLLPIHRSERVAYEGPVYNVEVDDPDHSYLAPFVAVANCQNWDISQAIKPTKAPPGSTPREIAGMMLALQARGCHNINFVTPEHVVPQVLEAVAEAIDMGLTLPIVYNTSAYDALESLELMDGIADIYMPDFKYWSAEKSRAYLKAEDYPEAAQAAIREMHRQVGPLVVGADGLARRGLIVRHLVMPGELNETAAILEWIASELGPDTYVNLMDQYYPAGSVDADTYPELDRRLRPDEFREARRMARDLGLRLDERRPSPRLRLRRMAL